ncbi:Uncharacterized protein FKW44_004905 [Caligus rogercresseyi]|uniref:HTH tetR-type domain-containing protein n=1 Tax=Caligus rogercresseyi TaxID=217165 RepID=A0A7T8HMI6_CALRO|nr:Uncharacterized protein FKW44_004905 [Caligus rogercresseyi]
MRIDTKTALLNSAEWLPVSRGFDGFSFADLAAEVGIRKASVHHHFPTKAALSVALMQRYCASFKVEVTTQINRFRRMMVQWLRAVFTAGASDGSIRDVADIADEAATALALIEGAQLAARTEENPDLFDRCLRILQQRDVGIQNRIGGLDHPGSGVPFTTISPVDKA